MKERRIVNQVLIFLAGTLAGLGLFSTSANLPWWQTLPTLAYFVGAAVVALMAWLLVRE